MKKLFLLLVLWLLVMATNAFAATIYVRTDGGNGTQCTGLVDDDQATASGTACALNHPNWVFPPRGAVTTRKAATGDTVVIKSGEYRIGCQNSANCTDANVNMIGGYCSVGDTSGCHMSDGGTSEYGGKIPNNITLIGCSTTGCSSLSDRPVLWGAGRVRWLLNMNGTTGALVKDIIFTDKAQCHFGQTAYQCGSADSSELSALDGILFWGGSNNTLTNVKIAGVYRYQIWGVCDGCTIDGASQMLYGFGGIDFTGHALTSGSQTFNIGSVANNNPDRMVEIAYSGCTDNGTMTGVPSGGCSTFGGADGVGGDNDYGVWTIQYANVHHNVADGLDLLYHDKGTGSIDIRNSYFGMNGGNQLKFSGNSTIYNNVIEGKCDFFSSAPYYTAAVEVCRAGGDAIAFTFQNATTIKFYGNSVIYNNGNDAFVYNGRGVTCSASNSMDIKNSIFVANGKSAWLGGGTVGWKAADSNCTSATFTNTNSVIYNHGSNPSGTGNIFTNPSLSGLLYSNGSAISTVAAYPPSAINIADEAASGQPSTDYNSYSRGGTWDSGALEYGSSYSGTPPACGNNPKEGSEVCDGTDLNSQTCVGLGYASGTLACNGTCTAYDTSSCVTNPCGNGNIDGLEECDGANLNNQTCGSLGYAAGQGTPGCSSCVLTQGTCVALACGNGTVDTGEECDDSNTTNSDGCSSICELETVGLEKFLTYTENDAATYTDVHTHYIDYTGLPRNVNVTTVKDFGASYFGDFTHRFGPVTIGSCTDNGAGSAARVGIWSLSNTLRSSWFEQEANTDGMTLYLRCFSSSSGYTWFLDNHAAVTSSSFSDVIPTLIRYVEVARTGSSVTAKFYSDANFTTQVGSTLTATNSTAYRYFYPVTTYNSSTANTTASGSVANYNLNYTGDPITPDTYGTRTVGCSHKGSSLK